MKASTTGHQSPVTSHDLSGSVPDLGYQPVPDVFRLPTGMNFGPCSSVAVNSKGNILVFNRSAHALMEFTAKGKYLRSLAQGIFTLPHGLRVIDASIMPTITSGNTNSPTVMIAQRASDMVIRGR